MRINDDNRKTINTLVILSIAERAKVRPRAKGRPASDYLKEAREVIKDFPIFQAIEDIKRSGGLNYALLRQDYGRDQVRDLMKRRPGLVSARGKGKLDEIAADNGFEDGELLMNSILETPSKSVLVRDICRSLIDQDRDSEWLSLGFEPTDGIYSESLGLGDQIYMMGEYLTFCGYDNHGFPALASREGIMKIESGKIPCDGIKRREKGG